MRLSDLTDPAKVVAAMDLCDRMTPEKFREKYGFGQARRYLVAHNGRTYDSKAIAGVAYGLQFPEREPLSSADFRGGTNTVKRLLTRLGFVVLRVDPQRTESGAWVFRDDEEAYLQWLKAHPEGLVVNAERDPSPGYLPLHRTTCWTINERNSAMAPGAFTKDYIKVCALDHETLLHWIEEQGGESFTDYCSKCDAPRPPPPPVREEEHWHELQAAVDASLARTEAERAARLAAAPDYPGFVYVMRREFARNPDVVAAVLLRAKGVCERCNSPAPFRRRSDGQPFLEVHHRRPLSKHGKDKPDNALALCPNCHRELHHGPDAEQFGPDEPEDSES